MMSNSTSMYIILPFFACFGTIYERNIYRYFIFNNKQLERIRLLANNIKNIIIFGGLYGVVYKKSTKARCLFYNNCGNLIDQNNHKINYELAYNKNTAFKVIDQLDSKEHNMLEDFIIQILLNLNTEYRHRHSLVGVG